MKKQLLKEIIEKKEKKIEFAIITNLENGESCVFEKDNPIDKNFEKYKESITGGGHATYDADYDNDYQNMQELLKNSSWVRRSVQNKVNHMGHNREKCCKIMELYHYDTWAISGIIAVLLGKPYSFYMFFLDFLLI